MQIEDSQSLQVKQSFLRETMGSNSEESLLVKNNGFRRSKKKEKKKEELAVIFKKTKESEIHTIFISIGFCNH